MDHEHFGIDAPDGDDDPATAFARLGREVALLRRAVDGLTLAGDVELTDYTTALMRTEQLLASLGDRIDGLADSLALTDTPATMVAKIVNAAHSARLDDQRLINEARSALDQATGEMVNRFASARLRRVQNSRLYIFGAGGTVMGALFWAAALGPFMGATARAWHSPRLIAAQTGNKKFQRPSRICPPGCDGIG